MSFTFVKNCCSSSLVVSALLTLGLSNAFPQAGSLDTGFDTRFASEFSVGPRSLAELPDGSMLVGFIDFSTPPSAPVYLVRVDTNGSAISTSVPFPGIFTEDGEVSVLSVLNDGKVIVGGIFTLGTNAGLCTLTRLNSDYTWDTNFHHAEIDGRLTCLTVQSDGKILIGGQFSQVQGVARMNIARLDADGSVDLSFTPPVLGPLRQFVTPRIDGITMQSNRVIIAGHFGSVGGITCWNIARLHADGAPDESFAPAFMYGLRGGVQSALSVSTDSAGRLLVCGQFGRMDNQSRIHVARLLPNGALDPSFAAPLYDWSVAVHRVFEEPNGKILIAGGFTTTGAVIRASVARLNSDGSVDPTFDPGKIQGGLTRFVRLANGKYFLGGQITSINGVPRSFVARLFGDSGGGPGKIQFTAPFFRTAEDASQPAQLVVTRTDGRTGAISLDFSTRTGTATAIDFAMTNGTVQFADGEFAPKTIDLRIVDDPWKETTEDFTVVLENPQGGVVLGQTNAAGVRINENDYSGSVDASFAPGEAAYSADYAVVNEVLLQPDGRLLVGGYFTPDNKKHFTRLNRDGSVDATFATGTGPSADVTAFAIQPDGRIVVAGNFARFNGTIVNGFVRVETNGTIDQSFSAGEGCDGHIAAMAVQPGGSILIGGQFDSINGVPRKRLARLDASGTVQPMDLQLTGDGYEDVNVITVLTNGSAYIGGTFERAGGLARNGLFRLLPNGSVDPNFRAATVTNQYDLAGNYTFYVYCVRPLPDGRILVGGNFYEVDGERRHGIVLLKEDGSLDRTFVPEFNVYTYISRIVRGGNGQFYVSGTYDHPGVPSYWIDGVMRLHSTGQVDWTFEPAFVDGFITALLIESNGQLIIGGDFDECAGTPRHNLARLNVETLPLIAIEKVDGGSVRVSWPASLGDSGLEGAGALNDSVWTQPSPAALSNGRYNSTNSTTEMRRFFRARN
jgi:uncharacterized delta-60 repeat protein